MNCFRYLKRMSTLIAAICTTTYLERKIVMARARKYYLKNNYLTLKSKVKVPRSSLRYATYHLIWSCTHIPNIIDVFSKDKNVMAQTRTYNLKNKHLTLRLKVKIPRRSLRYETHHLMVMHPHTK